MRVNIGGKGNMKLGNGILSISFPPITSCASDAPCKKECYAKKAYRVYANVRKSWNDNLSFYMSDPRAWWDSIQEQIDRKRKPVEFMRFFVSGDFAHRDMVTEVIQFASDNPGIKILAFTKRYDWLPEVKDIPSNLSIVVSVWPGYELKGHANEYPRAFMRDHNKPDARIPNDKLLECPGTCENCGMCWSLRDNDLDVVFNKH